MYRPDKSTSVHFCTFHLYNKTRTRLDPIDAIWWQWTKSEPLHLAICVHFKIPLVVSPRPGEGRAWWPTDYTKWPISACAHIIVCPFFSSCVFEGIVDRDAIARLGLGLCKGFDPDQPTPGQQSLHDAGKTLWGLSSVYISLPAAMPT